MKTYKQDRIWKKINKRAKELLIEAKIFKEIDWCDIEKVFYIEYYDGEYGELDAWDYLQLLAEESTEIYEYDDNGRYSLRYCEENMSTIRVFKQFKKEYL